MTRTHPLRGVFRASEAGVGTQLGKRLRCAAYWGLASQGATYCTTPHRHGEGDLFAVSERAAVDGDVVNLLPGCWSAQAWGLENPKSWKTL